MQQTATIDPQLIKWYNGLPELAQRQFMIDVLKQVNSRFIKFQQTYYNDFAALIHDCIDWRQDQKPTLYQTEILTDFLDKRRVAVRGPHGLGKTALAAWLVIAFALTRDGEDWKCPTTASAWRQLTKYLWPEIHKWSRRLKWDKIGRDPFSLKIELLALSLKLSTGEAFAASSDDSATMEGAHADHLLYVFDESKSIPDDTFDAAEGAFSGAGSDTVSEAYALSISTPGEPVGRFYDIHKRKPGYDDWYVRHITLEESVTAGRISQEWADQRQRQWGLSSAVYQNRVLGEFAASDEDSVIPLAWVELANERWRDLDENGNWGTFTSVGVDIGGGGEYSDKTVEALCFDRWKIKELRKFSRGDVDTATMEEAGRTKGILDANSGIAVLDGLGLGAGSYHRLREQGYLNAYSFIASQKAERYGEPVLDRTGELGFTNKRSAAWWIMRELLDPNGGELIALPPDDELTGELTTPKKRIMSGAKIAIESKDDIKKRLGGRSTDNADAVIQAIVGPELIDKESEIEIFHLETY